MTRAVACGDAFAGAVAVLGLVVVDDRPDVVLVDLRDPACVIRACAFDAAVPRVALGGPEHAQLLRGLGIGARLAESAEPAALGPLIAASLPAAAPRATRTVVVTGAAGGVGRTLLVAHVALRLAAERSVALLDVTGTGALGWWLGLAGGGWSELEGLADELASEHLAVVAAEEGRLRVVGGASAMPSPGLAVASVRAACGLADVVIVDAPPAFDDRTRVLCEVADRILFVARDDPSAALPEEILADDRTWLIGSRGRAERIGGRDVVRSLPDDPAAIRAAARGPSPVHGELSRAYDEVAELLAIDLA